jgi:tRNA(Ile)-lysidine synthase
MTAALTAARASGLLPAGRPVVVLCSGGRDSVCLLDVAVALAGASSVSALHVNYGLRDDAGEDERRCADLADGLGVPLAIHRPGSPPATGNLHAWAREIRYAEASRAAEREGARIAVGHTRTDQAETVIYRLAASPGRRALLGMAADDGRVVRPLLGVSREDTAAHCRARGLAWGEDPLNDDPRFARARVRGSVLPGLRSLHPAAEANIARTAEQLRDEAAVLDDVVATTLGGRDDIAVAELAGLPAALARLVVRRLAEDAVGGCGARAAGRLDELYAMGDGALDVGDGARAVVRGGRLRFARSEGAAAPRSGEPAPYTRRHA